VTVNFLRAERDPRGNATLPIDEEAAFAVELLPAIHAEPFGRPLIARSIANGMTIFTADDSIARYPVRVIW
jgi:PIN domain nuclease of toxin-antitoxin system